MSDYEAPGGDVVEVIGVGDLLTSPGTSYWLRDAISSSMRRDPVDALSDAEVLLDVLRRRLSLVELESMKLFSKL
ncbi:TPA: hypothetical protein ACG47G_004354 [Pseudomonas aeruginosa]|uniref:hypothetical protein n=1 Tax=Pseudomonas aeruginosa TaxID=287 RepID=UPI002113DEA8|nr:hypothetical protein [Pseudomonas aeruginosa]MDS9914874.1 hypothetical protein [Pseudomonas aeruginosa]